METSNCTSDMEKMSTGEVRIASLVEKYPDQRVTNLHHFIDEALLADSLKRLNKQGASGVDRQSWHDYNEEAGERLPALLASFKSGQYRAPHIRRTYIPKGDGKQRPLGIPTVEDKVLQTAVNRLLTPIYEREFYDFSYGFRPGRSQHQAVEALFKEVSFKGKRYVIDADMSNYFGNIPHHQLREFLSQRISDKVTERMISKWLKAGVLEDGQVEYPTTGTPQGGSISPLLSNIYLHYVLDEWFSGMVQPLLRGSSSMIRYADDFVMLFDNKADAERVMRTLPKRLEKYGLTLHPAKTHLIDLNSNDGEGRRTFDFLGFTHFMGKSRKGKPVLKRKTSGKKLRASLKRMNQWISYNRHKPVAELIQKVNQKMRGHYNYYGVTFNSRSLAKYYDQVKRLLFKWLNRRGGKVKLNWEKFELLTSHWLRLERPRIRHSYSLAKP